MENDTVEFEDGTNELKYSKTKIRKLGGGHAPAPRPNKRIILSMTKPSYVLGLAPNNVRAENRGRLLRLLGQLVRQHNWSEASGVLSTVLKGTCKDHSPVTNRMKYWVTMELQKRMGSASMNMIKWIYEIWMGKIGSMKNWPLEDRCVVQVELILFYLTDGDLEKAHEAVRNLIQDHDIGEDPVSSMVVGLTYYQLWYSTIPKEMQWANLDESYTTVQSDMSETRFDDLGENSDGSYAVDFHEADAPLHCDSDTSVMNDKIMSMDIDSNPHREASVEVDANLQCGKPHQSFQQQGFYMDLDESSGHEVFSLNYGDNMQDASIFYAHGSLDSWLLPLHLPENLEDYINLREGILNDYYIDALKYLRLALESTPPVLAALLPLVQLLLVGDEVKEARHEVEKLCQSSSTTLPLRLKASLLACFDHNNSIMLSVCYEDILKKDPTCDHSLARLISMHQNGNYGTEPLLEMIALHLDATYAECNIWREFASCFLKLYQSEEDRLSICLNESEIGRKRKYSVGYNRTPNIFTEGKSAKAWSFRCRWWLTRHFGKNTLGSEIDTGDLTLLTYKAACACHMYGREFVYVEKACAYLNGETNEDLLSILKTHMLNSTGFYVNYGPKFKR